jgi:hypothetical protein
VTEAQQHYDRGYKDGVKEAELHNIEDIEK